MKISGLIAVFLVGAIAPLIDQPAWAQSAASQSVGYNLRAKVDCQKLSSDSTQKGDVQSPIELKDLEKIRQQLQDINKLNNQGKYQKAILLAEQTLKTLKTRFPNRNEELEISFRLLGWAYQTQNEDEKAELMYLEMLKTRTIVGKQKIRTSLIKDSTGKVVKEVKDWKFTDTNINLSILNKELCDSKNDSVYASFLGSRTTTEHHSVFDSDKRIMLGLRSTVHNDDGIIIVYPRKLDLAFSMALHNLGTIYSRRNHYEWASVLLIQSREYSIATTVAHDSPYRQASINFLFDKIVPVNNYELALLFARMGKAIELSNLIAVQNPFALPAWYGGYSDASGNRSSQASAQAQIFSGTFLALNLDSSHPHKKIIDRSALLGWLRFKGLNLDGMTDSIQKCHQNSNPKITQYCNSWFETAGKLSRFVYQEGNINNIGEYESLTRQLNSAEKGIKEPSRGTISGRVFVGGVSNVQKLIPQNAALVEIVLYRALKTKPRFQDYFKEWRYVSAVLRSTGETKWVDLGKATEINAAIKQFRGALAKDGSLEAVQQSGRRLDQQVMAKIRPLLGNAKHLLISADGELNLVPFEALRDETGHYLIDRYQFSYLTSGRDLQQFEGFRKNPLKPRQGAVILADPDYDQLGTSVAKVPPSPSQRTGSQRSTSVDTIGSFQPLEGTREEALAIQAQALPGAQILMGKAATKTALNQLQSPKILLLATHGFFLPNSEKLLNEATYDPTAGLGSPSNRAPQQVLKINNPLLRSGLALAGFNRRNDQGLPADDNGVLTALEVAALNLQGTQLVVLSACETGVGEAKVGDGVYGLRRALVIAGAQSQVLSLWKVDDTATKDLMVSYFTKMVPKNGKQGKGRHIALQEAKQELMKTPQYQHPYYWASFIPSGDWTPLSQ